MTGNRSTYPPLHLILVSTASDRRSATTGRDMTTSPGQRCARRPARQDGVPAPYSPSKRTNYGLGPVCGFCAHCLHVAQFDRVMAGQQPRQPRQSARTAQQIESGRHDPDNRLTPRAGRRIVRPRCRSKVRGPFARPSQEDPVNIATFMPEMINLVFVK
jgi:hypothetical protein